MAEHVTPRIHDALIGLLESIDALSDAVADAREHPAPEPDGREVRAGDVVTSAQHIAIALDQLSHVVADLATGAGEWAGHVAQHAALATLNYPPAAATAYLDRVRETPERLASAARALALAARRARIDELRSYIEPPSTTITVQDDHAVQVRLIDEAPPRYEVLDAHQFPSHHGQRTRRHADAGQLADAIADAIGPCASTAATARAAQRARRQLDNVVRYRDTGQPGDAALAARQPTPPATRPDSSTDLIDLLIDLHRERWPIGPTVKDGLTDAARALATPIRIGSENTGLDRLLAHPAEDPHLSMLLRTIVCHNNPHTP